MLLNEQKDHQHHVNTDGGIRQALSAGLNMKRMFPMFRLAGVSVCTAYNIAQFPEGDMVCGYVTFYASLIGFTVFALE